MIAILPLCFFTTASAFIVGHSPTAWPRRCSPVVAAAAEDGPGSQDLSVLNRRIASLQVEEADVQVVLQLIFLLETLNAARLMLLA